MQKVNSVQQLGAQLRAIRKKQHLTQEQLAGIAGVGVRFIRELEQGKETCQWGKALLVMHMLGCQLYLDGNIS